MTNPNNPTTVEGLILTRQWLENPDGNALVFWLATEEGPLRAEFTAQESVCFFPGDQQPLIERTLGKNPNWRIGATQLRDFQQQSVAALYLKSQRQLFDARDRIGSKGLYLQEADVKPTDRFLMERFITGAAVVTGNFNREKGFLTTTFPGFKPSDYRPRLKAISLDIETDYQAEHLYSIGLYSESESLVLIIGEDSGSESAELTIRYFQDEARLLSAFVETIAALDPDVLIGWNVVNFDFRCLQRFADRANVELNLGRNSEPIRWRQAREGQDRFYALMPGRVILDGIELMRSATYQFENFSLEFVAQQLLGRGKLVDDVDQRGAEITELFLHDKLALARYNLEDCRLVWDIFDKEQLLEFAIERSLLTGLELDRYGGSVAALDFLYLPRLHRHGYVAPALEQLESTNISPGGYVMRSIPGIHDNVIVLDFKSLYPSIIRTFNVDPLALVTGLKEQDAIEGFDGGRFSRTESILPDLIETLWAARDKAKASHNAVLSQAIKIIMNSFYGVLGTQGCRFFDSRLVSSITKRGHDIIIQSKDFIEEQGYQVIYGDTDSVFVLLGDVAESSVNEIGNQLAEQLNTWWRDKLQREQNISSFLEMEFETHFVKFLMPTVRGSDAGSKKRYAGLLANGEVLFKGLETVRSDWSPLARNFQQVLYRKIFEDQPYIDYIKEVISGIQNGEYETELVLRKRLRRKLADYVKNVPPHVQAARKAEEIRQAKNLPSLYASGGWVEYLMTTSGPEPRQYRQSPIDYDFYIDKQLAPIADSILVFSASSLDKILDRQIGLF
ncbi:MAG: DNA polymerase II [Pseudomonadales bacterium]|nr:DNA polymerase II [Pseudomonadales bacterium]